MDRQTDQQTDRQILYIEANSWTAGNQGNADRLADGKTDVQKEGQLDRQTLKYLPLFTVRQPFMQASRQAGGLAGRKAGSKAGRQEDRQAVRQTIYEF